MVLNLEKLSVTKDGKEPGMLSIPSEVHRSKVPGGWLVFAGSNGAISGVTFYPDPKHEWKGDA
jgi:hypothetical protein